MSKERENSKSSFQLLEKFGVILSLVASDLIDLPQSVRTALNLLSYVILFFLVGRQFKRVSYTLTKDISLILVVFLAVFSLIWSADPDNTLAVIRGLLRSTVLGAFIATRYTLKEQINIYAWLFGAEAILSLLACIFFPSYGITITNFLVTWKGIFGHKQYLARTMALAIGVFSIKAMTERSSRRITIPLLGLCFALIVLSTSRTGFILIAATVGMSLLNKVAGKQYQIRASLLIILFLVISITSFLIVDNFEFIFVDLLGKDADFNGRLPLWQLAIQKGLERPLLGYGYGGFWNSDAGYYVAYNSWGREILTEAVNAGSRLDWHAHNGFVELFVQLGFVGLAMMGFNLLCTIKRVATLISLFPSFENLWILQVLIAAFISNSVEVMTLLASNSIFWVFYVSVALTAALKLDWLKRKIQASKSIQVPATSLRA